MDIGEDSAVMVAQGEVNLSSSGLVDEAELDGDMLLADGGSPERDRPLTDEQYVTEVVLDDENVVLGGDEIIMQAGEDSDQNIIMMGTDDVLMGNEPNLYIPSFVSMVLL